MRNSTALRLVLVTGWIALAAAPPALVLRGLTINGQGGDVGIQFRHVRDSSIVRNAMGGVRVSPFNFGTVTADPI